MLHAKMLKIVCLLFAKNKSCSNYTRSPFLSAEEESAITPACESPGCQAAEDTSATAVTDTPEPSRRLNSDQEKLHSQVGKSRNTSAENRSQILGRPSQELCLGQRSLCTRDSLLIQIQRFLQLTLISVK